MHFWRIHKLKIQEQNKIHFWRRLLNDLTFQQHMEVISLLMPDSNHILLYMQGIWFLRSSRKKVFFFSNWNLSNMTRPKLKATNSHGYMDGQNQKLLVDQLRRVFSSSDRPNWDRIRLAERWWKTFEARFYVWRWNWNCFYKFNERFLWKMLQVYFHYQSSW